MLTDYGWPVNPELFGLDWADKFQTIYHYEKKFTKRLGLLIFCIYSLNFSLKFFIMIFFCNKSAKYSKFLPLPWVPCSCFQLLNHYQYKKLSLYNQKPTIHFGLGYEFGLQRMRDLAFVCPYTVRNAILINAQNKIINHTVTLPYWTLTKWGHSNFAF